MTTRGKLLKFAPFKSQVDPSFWQRLTNLKLDKDKLNENVHFIWGYYSNRKPEGQNQLFSFDASSFNISPEENRLYGAGSIINKNTIEGFKDEDKLKLIVEEGKKMLELIKKEAIGKPSLLSRFLVLTFANLKNYQYYYWFAFPAPTFLSCYNTSSSECIKTLLSSKQMQILSDSYNCSLSTENKGFFFVKISNMDLMLMTVEQGINHIKEIEKSDDEELMLGFADTSSLEHPSWPLRNFIALVTYHCPRFVKAPVKIICLRQHFYEGQWRSDSSIILNVQVEVKENPWSEDGWTGWEKNEKGKMGPKCANMKNSMDPMHLAEMSVDLNLKLMKWQILPHLNLDAVKQSKCLLIGAGTLGCVVARNLMSWGVRHITFVDCGTVSHSNPVRQFLYKFQDVGKGKAETAAAAVREIFPGVVSSSFSFKVPMPGHPIGDSVVEETRRNVAKLEELITDHDVTFLLMDSRESRWLPTVIASVKEKLVINAALGFDSYLVMRHGKRDEHLIDGDNKSSSDYKLGCYFCHDVTAPGNSVKGRTLDQQCTVTRPGISNIAGALAVELFVSVLQHPLAGAAPAESDRESTETESCLGIIPHSIRGFLSHYQTLLPAVEAFISCVACSPKVINKYQEEGFNFIFKVLESKEYLEELCGLNILKNELLIEDILEYSDTESED